MRSDTIRTTHNERGTENMGMRKYYRQIARAQMEAHGMKFREVGPKVTHATNRKWMRTRKGRRKFAELRTPLWKKVLGI